MALSDSLISGPTRVQGVGGWTVSWMLGLLFFWAFLYFFAFHLVFGIPQSSLYVPFAVHYALTALLGPVFYVARKRVIASNGAKSALNKCLRAASHFSLSNNVGPCQALFKDTSFFSPKRVFSFVFFRFLSSLHRRPRLVCNLSVGFSPTQPSLRSKLRP